MERNLDVDGGHSSNMLRQIKTYPTLSNYRAGRRKVENIFRKFRRTKRFTENRYESFSDQRAGCSANILINGESYFKDLYYSMMEAKRTIYIAGFALSPELFLIRPVSLKYNFYTRLIDVIRIKAEQGVQVKILIYKEVMGTLPIESYYAKKQFSSLHTNIKIRRHPRNVFNLKVWANHEKVVIIDEEIAYVGGIDLFWGRCDNSNHKLTDEPNDDNLYTFPGLDYSNDRFKDKTDLSKYFQDDLNRVKQVRMPWHDVAVRLEGPVVIDVWRHFMQRWLFRINHRNKYPVSFSKLKNNLDDYLYSRRLDIKDLYKGNLNCQILRSASHWSVGNHTVETSILNAYCDLIDNAHTYILIENQFFISNTYSKEDSNGQAKIYNNIAFHLRKRIERAYLEKQKFKVFLFIPLIPGFSGHVEETQSIKSLIKYTYRTLIRRKGLSLIEKLIDLMGSKYEDYLGIFSLRNHAMLGDTPKTELIYIHAKIMLIDDEKAIIGSANINDRSLLGSRDSEVAVLISDSEQIKQMRIQLLQQHMGVDTSDNILNGNVNDELWHFIKSRATKNTLLYQEIFRCLPDDTYLTFEDISSKYDENCRECLQKIKFYYTKLKDQIIGHIVDFPLNFLKNEDLSRSFFSKEKAFNINIFL